MLRLHQYGDFELLYQALCGSAESVILCFPNGVEGYQQDAKAAVIRFVKARIGNYIIDCCLGVVGSLSLISNQQMLVGEKLLVGQQFVKTGDMTITGEQIESGLNELVEELQNEELAVIVVN